MARVTYSNGWFVQCEERIARYNIQGSAGELRRSVATAKARLRKNGALGEVRFLERDGSAGAIHRAYDAWRNAGRPETFTFDW
jgi:hypothetical protein